MFKPQTATASSAARAVDGAAAAAASGEADLLGALAQVIDPELGINIVDLGLIYSAEERVRRAHIAMTMTTPACPMNSYLSKETERALRRAFPHLSSVEVEIVWEPKWRPEMMSDAAKRQLGWR
jgi:metal-sulfur cluster biosynthetic enzyme